MPSAYLLAMQKLCWRRLGEIWLEEEEEGYIGGEEAAKSIWLALETRGAFAWLMAEAARNGSSMWHL